jgi:signal transduction histidine kinase
MYAVDTTLPGSTTSEILPAGELSHYARGLERLLDAVQALGAAGDRESLADIVRRAARELTASDAVSLVLHDGVRFSTEEDPAAKRRAKPYELKLLQSLADHATAALKNLDRTLELESRVTDSHRRLELTLHELEALSYSVSHDLRAPLRAIAGFNQVAIQDHGAKLDADGLGCLHRVQASAVRMGRLIDDLLELSRITRVEVHHAPVDLTALAEEQLVLLRQREPERAVRTLVAPGLSALGDAALLRRALSHLLANAWKFTSKTADAEIVVSGEPHAGTARFVIRDNGVGFDPKYAERLFTPFQRLHPVDEFPGDGVGLSLVQRIVRRHGGNIEAEGNPGKGASFAFTLPSRPPK